MSQLLNLLPKKKEKIKAAEIRGVVDSITDDVGSRKSIWKIQLFDATRKEDHLSGQNEFRVRHAKLIFLIPKSLSKRSRLRSSS